MRILAIILALLFLVLQYDLWLGDGSLATVWRLHKEIEQQKEENKTIKKRNDSLVAEVKDLKEGDAEVEERARNELGMIKEGETYIQVIEPEKNKKK